MIDTLSDDLIAFEDTLSLQKQFVQAGGVMAFDISASASIFSSTSMAMKFQLLFGSSRQSKNLLVDEIPYSISSRLNYSGVNTILFLKHYAFGYDFFLRSQFAFKPLEAIQTKLYPYFDTNKNGYHDFSYDYLNPGYDFPNLMMFQVQSKVGFQIFMSPYLLVLEYQIQFTKDFRFRLNTKIKENASYSNQIPNGFNKRIIEDDKISFGAIWYPNKQSFKFLDNLTFRSGLFFNNFATDELSDDSTIN